MRDINRSNKCILEKKTTSEATAAMKLPRRNQPTKSLAGERLSQNDHIGCYPIFTNLARCLPNPINP